MKLYKLIVNENQLKIIQQALESYFRMGIGQLDNVLFNLGFQNYEQFKDRMSEFHKPEIEASIKVIKYKIFDLSSTSTFDISSLKVHENFKVCHDLFMVIKSTIDASVDIPKEKTSKDGFIEIEVYGE